MRFFWKWMLQLFGWKTNQEFPFHHLKKFIIIVAPHTSNWDFMVGLAYRSLLGLQKTRFLGKAELFKPPFGFIFRWLGGTPVDRKSSNNMVDVVAEIFDRHESYSLALSPEGTRKRVDKLRTGFYYIAQKAKVPIIMVGFDYKGKQAVIAEPFYTTSDPEKDFDHILNFYRNIQGKVPEKGLSHL